MFKELISHMHEDYIKTREMFDSFMKKPKSVSSRFVWNAELENMNKKSIQLSFINVWIDFQNENMNKKFINIETKLTLADDFDSSFLYDIMTYLPIITPCIKRIVMNAKRRNLSPIGKEFNHDF